MFFVSVNKYHFTLPAAARAATAMARFTQSIIIISGRIDEAVESYTQDQFEILLYKKNSKLIQFTITWNKKYLLYKVTNYLENWCFDATFLQLGKVDSSMEMVWGHL